MVNDQKLGAIIAREIFAAFDQPHDKCQRIEGKGGQYPDAETRMGGFGEEPLAEFIERVLTKHRSY